MVRHRQALGNKIQELSHVRIKIDDVEILSLGRYFLLNSEYLAREY